MYLLCSLLHFKINTKKNLVNKVGLISKTDLFQPPHGSGGCQRVNIVQEIYIISKIFILLYLHTFNIPIR